MSNFNSLLFLYAKKDFSKLLFISTDGLLRLIGFGNQTQSNSHNFFGLIVFDCRTQLNPIVRLHSIEFGYRTVRIVSSGKIDNLQDN